MERHSQQKQLCAQTLPSRSEPTFTIIPRLMDGIKILMGNVVKRVWIPDIIG
jgi:hypothetical protein